MKCKFFGLKSLTANWSVTLSTEDTEPRVIDCQSYFIETLSSLPVPDRERYLCCTESLTDSHTILYLKKKHLHKSYKMLQKKTRMCKNMKKKSINICITLWYLAILCLIITVGVVINNMVRVFSQCMRYRS